MTGRDINLIWRSKKENGTSEPFSHVKLYASPLNDGGPPLVLGLLKAARSNHLTSRWPRL